MWPIRHIKRQKGKTVTSDGTTEEYNDSSSKTDSDDGTMEMTLVVVRHLPHKKQLMSNFSLPSQLTNSHIAPRIKITRFRIAKNSLTYGECSG
jgi:hypothetical protein